MEQNHHTRIGHTQFDHRIRCLDVISSSLRWQSSIHLHTIRVDFILLEQHRSRRIDVRNTHPFLLFLTFKTSNRNACRKAGGEFTQEHAAINQGRQSVTLTVVHLPA